MSQKAELYGRAQYDSVRGNWATVAETFDSLAEAEQSFVTSVLG
jgi:hypothetical protein